MACNDWGNDQCTGGTASASSEAAPHTASKAFDDSTADGWYSTTDDTQWIQYQLVSGKTIEKIRIKNAASGFSANCGATCWTRSPTTFQLKASNTGAFGGEEVTLLSITEPIYSPWTTWDEWREWTFSNSTSYVYYRMYMQDKQDDFGKGYEYVIDEIELYECQDEVLYYFSGYVFEEGSPVSRILYLHDRSDGSLVDTTTSSGNGYYYLETTISGAHYIICLDNEVGENFNDMILGNMFPITVSG